MAAGVSSGQSCSHEDQRITDTARSNIERLRWRETADEYGDKGATSTRTKNWLPWEGEKFELYKAKNTN